MLVLRRCAAVVAGVLVAGALGPVPAGGAPEVQAPPEPSDEIEVTYLEFPEGGSWSETGPWLSRSGEVVRCQARGDCYLWDGGDVTTIASDDGSVTVSDISDRGHVVGTVYTGEVRIPFLWKDGELTTLPLSGATQGWAVSVNNHGEVAGYVSDALGVWNAARPRAAVWRDGELVQLPDAGWFSARATDINDRSQVAVSALHVTDPEDPDGFFGRAALWDLNSNEVVELGTLGGQNSEPVALNNRGMVMGESETAGGDRRVFLWYNGEMTDLGTLGGDTSRARGDLNEWGQVVGITTDADGQERGFLWYDGEMIDLGIDGIRTGSAEPKAINNWGQVVGYNLHETSIDHQAFLWQNGRVADLGELVEPEWPFPDLPESPGWEDLSGKTTAAIDVNDRGRILGWRDQLFGPRAVVSWDVSPLWGYPTGPDR